MTRSVVSCKTEESCRTKGMQMELASARQRETSSCCPILGALVLRRIVYKPRQRSRKGRIKLSREGPRERRSLKMRCTTSAFPAPHARNATWDTEGARDLLTGALRNCLQVSLPFTCHG